MVEKLLKEKAAWCWLSFAINKQNNIWQYHVCEHINPQKGSLIFSKYNISPFQYSLSTRARNDYDYHRSFIDFSLQNDASFSKVNNRLLEIKKK